MVEESLLLFSISLFVVSLSLLSALLFSALPIFSALLIAYIKLLRHCKKDDPAIVLKSKGVF